MSNKDIKIEDAGFSSRTLDVLRNKCYSSYSVLGDLSAKTQGEMMRDMKSGGRKTLNEIESVLVKNGLHFKGEKSL